MESDPEPKRLSIITVVYNGADTIESTIQSVIQNRNPQLEYIVVDGGSSDGTLEKIQDNAEFIDTWVSDRDRGLYDAMNKGMALAKGEFIWFINSGDQLASNDTVKNLLPDLDETTDIVYGEVMIINENGKELGTRSALTTQHLPQKLDINSLQYGMTVCHQGFIVRKSITQMYRLDNLCADIEWVIECIKRSRKSKKVNYILAKYLAGGISKKKWRQSMIDRYLILQKYYGMQRAIWSHFVITGRSLLHKLKHIGKPSY